MSGLNSKSRLSLGKIERRKGLNRVGQGVAHYLGWAFAHRQELQALGPGCVWASQQPRPPRPRVPYLWLLTLLCTICKHTSAIALSLLRYGQHGGCEWCGTVPSIPGHGAVSLTSPDELLVAVPQVGEVGGGDLRRMADFRGASRVEMQGWPAEEWVYGELQGAAQPGGTLRRGLAHWLGGWRL